MTFFVEDRDGQAWCFALAHIVGLIEHHDGRSLPIDLLTTVGVLSCDVADDTLVGLGILNSENVFAADAQGFQPNEGGHVFRYGELWHEFRPLPEDLFKSILSGKLDSLDVNRAEWSPR